MERVYFFKKSLRVWIFFSFFFSKKSSKEGSRRREFLNWRFVGDNFTKIFTLDKNSARYYDIIEFRSVCFSESTIFEIS